MTLGLGTEAPGPLGPVARGHETPERAIPRAGAHVSGAT